MVGAGAVLVGGDEAPMGLPPPNPTRLPPHTMANNRTTSSLPTSVTVGYAIVESGVSGAALAYKLPSHDSSLSNLMLEVRTAASDALGRNDGLCPAGWWTKYKNRFAAFGEEDTIELSAWKSRTY